MSPDIRYQPLKTSDVGDIELIEPKSESAKDSFQIHWSLKLLCLGFITIQIIYVGYSSRIDYFYQETKETLGGNQSPKIAIELYSNDYDVDDVATIDLDKNNADELIAPVKNSENEQLYELGSGEDNSKWTEDDFIPNTLAPSTKIAPERDQFNSTFPRILPHGVINNETTTKMSIIAIITASNGKTHNASDDDFGIRQPSTSVIELKINSTNEKSHDITNLTMSKSMASNTTATATTTTTPNTLVTASATATSSSPSIIERWSRTIELTTTISHRTTYSTTTPRIALNVNTTTISSDHLAVSKTQPKYFINTSKCHITYVDPFTKEVRKMFKPSHTTGCTKDKAITSISFDLKRSQYILHINYTVAMTFVKNSTKHTIVEDLQCCYRQIERGGSGARADSTFVLLPCTNFHQDFVIPVHIQGIIVDCTSKSMNKLLQQDAFSFIQVQQQANSSSSDDTADKADANGPKKLGILLLGIDSLSRINFRRTMPETLKYLVDKGWFELKGYNKVGDNTFPNLMPLLSGYTRATTYAKCNSKALGYDDCNFIWTKFRQHGFKTAYAEDTTTISTFNYHAKGFRKPPTDHYFRPFALGIEKTMKKTQEHGLYYCVGRRQYGEYVYDYGLEFATRYQNRSNFGFFWTNSFSHNYYSTAATMDRNMVNYLKELEAKGILESSVVMLFSDHGRRWGPLLKLPEGFLEERLPMFFMSLPSWFNKEYRDNLIENQKRLVTPFDIHMTLQHLLHMTAPAHNITAAYDCPMAQSIFQEIPENRTCADACIPEAWCTCVPYMVVPTKNATVKKITQMIVNEMNRYYVTKNITSLCSKLTIHEITQAKFHAEDDTSQSKDVTTYMIDFATNPKTKPATLFSATVKYDAKREQIELNVDDISRLSEYKNTAKCIDDKQAQKYCICKNSLKS